MTLRALIVEDDHKIASFLTKGLKQAGWAIDQVGTGEEASTSRCLSRMTSR
jgi:DNA-binding response OmpR family regulator